MCTGEKESLIFHGLYVETLLDETLSKALLGKEVKVIGLSEDRRLNIAIS